MLTEHSLLMMLLIVTASLVGISSSIYKPANVETQPQSPQQPLQSPQQPLQSPQSPQSPQLNTPTQALGKRLKAEDKALADRLLPYIYGSIIQKIDGKTLAQKIDTETLINKIGGKRLAQIVLPYIQLKFGTSIRESAVVTVKKGGLTPQPSIHQAVATCPPESKITGGGVVIMARAENALGGAADNQIIESRYGQLGNTWLGVVRMESGGSFYTQAVCAWPSLKVID